MDWQVIILTLGASLITGLVSLFGNIIVTRSNIKKTILEKREQNKNDFMFKRMNAYKDILEKVNYLEENLDKKDALEESGINHVWHRWYPYCSDDLNYILHMLIRKFNEIDRIIKGRKLSEIREQMKIDIDEYYGQKKKSRK